MSSAAPCPWSPSAAANPSPAQPCSEQPTRRCICCALSRAPDSVKKIRFRDIDKCKHIQEIQLQKIRCQEFPPISLLSSGCQHRANFCRGRRQREFPPLYLLSSESQTKCRPCWARRPSLDRQRYKQATDLADWNLILTAHFQNRISYAAVLADL
jgi:hypothetical protein